jgi:hypothetical protein
MREAALRGIVEAINAMPETRGVAIGYYGDLVCRQLSNGDRTNPNFHRLIIIVEEAPVSGVQVATRPAPVASTPPREASSNSAQQAMQTNGSRLAPELIGAGLSCGFTVISAVGVVGSAAAEVPTAGASTILLVASWAGLVTSGIQCINGVVRVVEIARNPEGTSLAEWDNNAWYSGFIFVVDAVGVASGVASAGAATRNLLAVLERRGGLVTTQQLMRMNRAGRAEAMQRAIAQASRSPESAAVLREALEAAGAEVRAAGGLSRVAASRAAAVIAEETTRRLHRAVAEVLGAYGGPLGSALPASWVGSASGSVNTTGGVIIHALGVSSSS